MTANLALDLDRSMLNNATALRLMAVLAAAFGLWSDSAEASCDVRPPTPQAVSALVKSDTAIEFKWETPTYAFFDIFVRDGADRNVGMDITGGAQGQKAMTFRGLTPNTEYRFALRARTEGGTEGCVSAQTSNWVVARTPTTENHGICAGYAVSAIKQFCKAVGCGCERQPPARWHASFDGHYYPCLDWRAKGQTFDVAESMARDNTYNACAAARTKEYEQQSKAGGHPAQVCGLIEPWPCPQYH
jgi:hypothetical protein